MKNNFFTTLALLFFSSVLVNAQTDIKDADASNTWLKLGFNTALPLSDFSKTNNFGLGLDASIQFLETKSSGIGIKAGYLHYFGKDGNSDVDVLPLALMLRFYPESSGWFAGLELGYAFLSGVDRTSGGYFVRPQVGLHYDFWNFFAYYDLIVTEETDVIDLQTVGIGVTYNLHFKGK